MKKAILYCCSFLPFVVHATGNITPIFSLENMPSVFIENKGQVKDQFGKVNEEVRFIYSNKLFNLQLRKGGFSYEFFELRNNNGIHHGPESDIDDEEDFDNYNHATISSSRVDINLLGANPAPELVAEEKTGTLYNYYVNTLPNKGFEHIPGFEKITYKNIYPGIDLVFITSTDSNKPTLKYSFIVQPNADASKIRLVYKGAAGLALDQTGDLQIVTSKGYVSETNLFCFTKEDQNPVSAKMELIGNVVHFEMPYFFDKTLVIDPNIIWGTYYGGEKAEEYNVEISINDIGEAIIVGTTNSLNQIATIGSFQNSFGGGYYDFCIAKFSSKGKLLWSTYFGGSDKEFAYSIAVDHQRNIIVTGNSMSDSITTLGAFQTQNAGKEDVLLAKFTTSGLLVWSTFYGGTSRDEARGVCVDNDDNIYIGGYTESSNGIATNSVYQEVYGGNGDAFIAKFSSSGLLLSGSYFGGNGQDRAHAICLDQSGGVYIEGTCQSESGIATPDAHQTLFGGHTDAFLAKFNTINSSIIWGTYYGGNGDERARGVVVDSKGNIYISGSTHSIDNISTSGAFQEQLIQGSPTSHDAFVAKFNAEGKRLWGTYYGGNGDDLCRGIALDSGSNIYFGGETNSDNHITSTNAFQLYMASEGKSDGFLVKMDSSGERLMGTYIGGQGGDIVYDLVVDENSIVYLVIFSTYTNFPVTSGTYQMQNNGGSDYVICKFNADDNCFDANEPNNYKGSAKELYTSTDSLSFGINGSIFSASDKDWFKIELVEGQTNLKIELKEVTKKYKLKLFNDQFTNVKTVQGADTSDQVTLIYNNSATGEFFLKIFGDNENYDSINCYRLNAFVSDNPFRQSFHSLVDDGTGNFSNDFVVYPNPASSQIRINLISIVSGIVVVTIYDVFNRQVFKEEFEAIEGSVSKLLDVRNLTTGTYLIQLKQLENTCMKRVVISK